MIPQYSIVQQQALRGADHHLRRINHILYRCILVSLVYKIRNTGATGNTILQSGEAVSRFLIAGTVRDHE